LPARGRASGELREEHEWRLGRDLPDQAREPDSKPPGEEDLVAKIFQLQPEGIE